MSRNKRDEIEDAIFLHFSFCTTINRFDNKHVWNLLQNNDFQEKINGNLKKKKQNFLLT